jgi:hypothetical protein
MSIEAGEVQPKQFSHEEALELNKTSAKQYKAGQISGNQWILNSPDLWAFGASLSTANNKNPPRDRFSTSRQNQSSVKATIGESNTKGLQLEGLANIRPLQDKHATESTGGGDYVFPKQFTSKERELAKIQLKSIGFTLAQALLDELAARLNANKVTGAPLSYLRALVNRANTGQFTPEAGIKIASVREQAQLNLRKKEAQTMKPNNPSEISKHLAAMHQILEQKTIKNKAPL